MWECLLPLGRKIGWGELAVEPFSLFADENWQGEDAFVLTLWTDHPRRSPFRFCFSAAALEAMEEESCKAREKMT